MSNRSWVEKADVNRQTELPQHIRGTSPIRRNRSTRPSHRPTTNGHTAVAASLHRAPVDAAHVESLGEAAVDLEARAVDVMVRNATTPWNSPTQPHRPNGLRSWTAASKPASAFSPAVRSVEMYPGQTQLTVTPSQPSSTARDRVKPSSACLDAQYAGWPVRPTWLIMEPTLMMRPQPCRCICTAASCANTAGPIRLQSRIRLKAAVLSVSSGCRLLTPALFTRMSSRRWRWRHGRRPRRRRRRR